MTAVTELADAYVEALFAADPLMPALLGIRPAEPGLPDLSAEAEQALRAQLTTFADQARALDPAGLSAEDRVTREVLITGAEGRVAAIDTRMSEFTVTDLFIAPASMLLTALPMATVADGPTAEAQLGRLAAVPELLRQAARRHAQGIADGLLPVQHLVDGAIAHLDRYLAEPDADPLRRQPAPDETFASERERLLADVVRPAFAEYREFLAAEVAPHGRAAEQPGVSWLPGGGEIYAKVARQHTTTDRTPAELHQTGLDIIATLATEYRELGAKAFGTDDLQEIFRRLRTDPALRWTSGEELMDTARTAIERAAAAAPRWFARIPPQPWDVQPIPEEAAPGAPGAYYLQPAADGSRPGIYFANTYQAAERFRHAAEATAFHEAIPGHHFQLSFALGLTELPLLRRIGDFTAYTEGWGLYTERLAEEMGLYSDDVARLGMLTLDSMRAGRLVVDTGLHALGWTRQQAVDYLVEHTPMSQVEIESEVDRYIAWPGQALAYMVGRLEILRIRAAAQQKLGSRFDIRAFHDVVLSGGALPLSVLEHVVNEWVAGYGDTANGLADEVLALHFEKEPTWPSILGLPGPHDRLADQSAAEFARLRTGYADVVTRARALDPATLSVAEKVTQDVVISHAETAIDRLDSRLEDFSVSNGLHSPALANLLHLSSYALDDEAKARGYLSRLAGIETFLDTLIGRQRAALADGLVPPAYLAQVGVEYVDRYLASPDSDPLRVTPTVPVEGFEAERDRLLQAVVRPAYARYRDFLADEVVPVGSPETEPGIGHLPGGAERYAALIRAETTTERTAQELHDTGLAIIERLAAEYRRQGAKVFGTEDLTEIFDRLRTDPALRWRDGEELMEAARDTIARAESVAPQWFSVVPAEKCDVLPVPESDAKSGTIAYYLEPSMDGTRPGRYYANTYGADQRPRFTGEAIAFHEAVPGHHFQLSLAQGLTDLPLLRRVGMSTAYVEGWGLYAERLADEMGLYTEVGRFGLLSQDSLRAGRLVVDTGVHALGWTRQQAIGFLSANTPLGALEIESEVDRYISWPGQALSYMVGRLEIQRLRADAEAALGERFDIREFHDVVLGNGILPLPALGNVVAAWVADAPERLADELVALSFEQQPMMPSIHGLPGSHDRLADPSVAEVARIRAAYADLAARAEALDVTRLSADGKVTRNVVISQAETAIDHLDSRLDDLCVSDGLSAPALQLLLFLPHYVLDDEAKARGYLARLAGIAPFLDALIERQRAALAEGIVPPAFLARIGVEYVDRYLGAPETDPLLVTPAVPVEGFEAERDRLLAEVVRPAYTRYRDFLAEEVAPVGKPETEPGIGHLPGGQEKYAALIRAETTTRRTAQELHDTGLEVMDRLADEYRELGAKVFGTSDLAEIFERLRTDPALRWRDGDELLDAARAAITRAEVVAPQWFSSVPEANCEVAPVPESDAASGTIAYYLQPSMDGTRPGTYYANTYEAHQRARFTSEAIAFHEAVPGHHFQLSMVQELTELPLLRRIAHVNAYVEGWGLYAERLADEMGLYTDDLSRFGMLCQDSMRAGRLVVDTGLHALGWTRQQAVDFFAENTPMARLEIDAEVDRYVANPGQALGYMVGRLEIQRLRAEAEAALGDRFDIRGFHDVVLGHGPLPLPVLAEVVADWIASA